MFTRCPYCQQDVPQWEYQNHLVQHGPQATARQPQMAMHSPPMPGMAPAPAGVVRQYYHPACGGSSAMPPQALAQMAADPFAFGDKTTCACCGKQVPEGEMFWSDTGQSLADSRQEMKNNYVFANKLNPEDFEWTSAGPVRRKTGGGPAAGLLIGGIVAAGGVLVLLGLAMVFAFSGAESSSSPPRPKPQPGFTTTTPQPVYTPPPTYTPPPSYTAAPPATYTPPPSYSAVPPKIPGVESTDEIMARMRRESEQRMEEMRKRSEQMRRESQQRMEEARRRAGFR